MSRNQRRNRRNKSGGNPAANRNAPRANAENRSADVVVHRSSSETKSSLKTTELIAYVVVVLGVIMTALALDGDGTDGSDPFGAESAIRYIAYLTVGYLIARGLAKSGSYERRVDDGAGRDDHARPDVVYVDDVQPDEGDDQSPIDADDADDVEVAASSAEVEHVGAGTSAARP